METGVTQGPDRVRNPVCDAANFVPGLAHRKGPQVRMKGSSQVTNLKRAYDPASSINGTRLLFASLAVW